MSTFESLAAAAADGPRQLRNPHGDNSALFLPDDPAKHSQFREIRSVPFSHLT